MMDEMSICPAAVKMPGLITATPTPVAFVDMWEESLDLSKLPTSWEQLKALLCCSKTSSPGDILSWNSHTHPSGRL